MIFITSYRKLKFFDNFLTFKTQNTEYNYIYMQKIIYIKNSKRLWKYIKIKQKVTAFIENI